MHPLDEDTAEQPVSMKVNSLAPFHAFPAISCRIRYHKMNDLPGRAALVASLDMEIAPFSKDDIELSHVDIQLADGTATDLGQGVIPELPLRCRPKDNVVFLY